MEEQIRGLPPLAFTLPGALDPCPLSLPQAADFTPPLHPGPYPPSSNSQVTVWLLLQAEN